MESKTWEEAITSMVKEISPETRINHNFIYGYTDAGMMASLRYGNLAVLDMDYYIVVFANNQLLLLEVSMAGNLTGNYGSIPYSDIETFKAKRGLLQYILTFRLAGEQKPLIIKSNRKMLNAQKMGMGWQKENLEFMANQGWDGLA